MRKILFAVALLVAVAGGIVVVSSAQADESSSASGGTQCVTRACYAPPPLSPSKP